MTSRRTLFRLILAALFLAHLTRAVADEAPASFQKWEKEIAAIEQRDGPRQETKGAILFVGSSSIKNWTTVAADFPRHRVLNHGFGGSQLRDAAHFADRLVTAFEPRFILVYSGGNDINAGRTADQVLASFKDFVAAVRAKQPTTPIAYISIAGNPKRWAQVEEVKRANALVEAFTKEQPHLEYIDVFHPMLGADGLPKPEIFVSDRLHMNAEGYKIWTAIVGPRLPAPDLK
jgi:lysophospholipase L1-like esterase